MERRVERAGVAARAGVKPVALQHAVVERGIGVLIVGVGLVERAIRGGAILLTAIGFEQRTILPVGQRDPLARAQRDRRELHVRRGQRRIAVVRDAVEPAGVRQQALALLVEHVLLLVKQALDGKPVDRERRVRRPSTPRIVSSGMASSSGIEPGARLLLTREQNLHLLPTGVDLVVPLILVVVQRGVVPDAIAERAHLVHRRERRQQRLRARCERALKPSRTRRSPRRASRSSPASRSSRRQMALRSHV